MKAKLKSYNWKARQVVKTQIDDSEQVKIQVDLKHDQTKFDASNALVLPSKKRKTKKLHDKSQPVKFLSRKQRKKLEKLIDQKKKKENRVDLLQSLKDVQFSQEKLSSFGLVSLQYNQTRGRKKYQNEDVTTSAHNKDESKEEVILNVTRGKKRKHVVEDKTNHCGPNVVALGDISSSSEDESEDMESEDEVKIIHKDDVAFLDNTHNHLPKRNSDSKLIKNNKLKPQHKSKCSEIELDKSEVAEINKTDGNWEVTVTDDKLKTAKNSEVTVINEKLKTTKNSEVTVINEELKTTKDSEVVVTGEKLKPSIKSQFKLVNRDPSIQEVRLKLPVLSEEQVVMEAISENNITIVVGPTGSGKTTQIPQFLYEAGYTSKGMLIGVTEPRRVAAMAMSHRVGVELNEPGKVSYQIRFEGNTSPDTEIKFMTDGVLLKEVQMDPLLRKYSAIVIDEAHERSVYSDILIGILSRIIPKRVAKGKPLKLIIMSATLRIDDFVGNQTLFRDMQPPVVEIPSRMFNVTTHFNKKTPDNYMEDCFKKACKINEQLPEGGILVFVTGQQEVRQLCTRLKEKYPMSSNVLGDTLKNKISHKKQKVYHKNTNGMEETNQNDDKRPNLVLPEVKLSSFLNLHQTENLAINAEAPQHLSNIEEENECCLSEDEDGFMDSFDCNENTATECGRLSEYPLYVVPLYSMLAPEKQKRVFDPPPDGMRLCVVATNVAETSLTIPNIKYVVDSGKVKDKVYDPLTGVSSFHITWISQASADQRSGRAGRTSHGHSYRLYSSAVFNNDLQKHSTPDIQKRPIADLVLVMKSMGLPVVNFPFPTPPNKAQIRQSLKELKTLGALETRTLSKKQSKLIKNKSISDLTVITKLGTAMSRFPLSPRYAKMLVLSLQNREILQYTTLIVCALTVKEVLVEIPLKGEVEPAQKKLQAIRHVMLGSGRSKLLGDIMILLKAVGAAEYQGECREWCKQNGLRYKAMEEIRKLRRQLTNEINMLLPQSDLLIDPKMPPPSDNQALLLQQIVLAGSIDHIARRVHPAEIPDPKDRAMWKKAYRVPDVEGPVFISTTSALYHHSPDWVVFQEIYTTSKMFMRGVTAIESKWIPIYAPHLCSFSPPLSDPTPFYDTETDCVKCYRTATFSSLVWSIPQSIVDYPKSRPLFSWFAMFFLNGDICEILKKFAEFLYDTSTLVSPVAIRFQEKRESLISMLMSMNVSSLCRLKEVWESDSKFLLKQYLMWVKEEEVKPRIIATWPPLSKKKMKKSGARIESTS